MNRILIVDDDTDLLFSLKTLLRRKGYEVKTTTTCVEAASLVQTFSPDLVLLDINVGCDDGRETCKEIRAIAKYEATPIILISADPILLATYDECNATSYLGKPFDATSLLAKIDEYIMA